MADAHDRLMAELLEAYRLNTAMVSATSIKLQCVDDLYRVVLEGDGQPSHAVQLITLAQAVQGLKLTMDAVEKRQDALALERRRGHWALLVACISGLIGIAGIVLGRLLR